MNQPPNFPASTPTPLEYSLFSPSKAAEQQRLAKDWNYVHQFLRQKYPSPAKVPKFEENEETLRMLLALAAANEKADEGWGQVCGVEEMGLRELEGLESEGTQDVTNTLNNTLTTSLLTSLSTHGTSDLTSQATAAVTLNTTTTSATTLATTLLSLSTTLSHLQNQIAATTSLQTSLLAQHSSLQTELEDLLSPTFQTEKNLPQRRNASGEEIPEALLSEVETSKRGLEGLVQRVKDVEDRIEVFEGVPPEAREVRKMMQEMRAELEGWVRRRDEMFEGLVGGRR